MKIFFDWSSEFSEEKKEWRGDEQLISLDIFQRECSFATAKVVIVSQSVEKIMRRKYAKIGIQKNKDENVELIFSGRIVSFPSGFGSSSVTMELISEPDDYQQQLRKFSQDNFENYNAIDMHNILEAPVKFDNLFFAPSDLQNPSIFLEGGNDIFYWNPKNGKLSLSNINSGKKNFDIYGSDILKNSIKVRLEREPYKNVNVSISASWIQNIYGFIDVYPMTAERFKLKTINSYTNIKSALEKICNVSQRNGCYLIRCDLHEYIPGPEVGFIQDRPRVSPKFSVREKMNAPKKAVCFERFYLKGKMIFGWSYKQKRTEVVNVKVVNKNSKFGREKNIYIKSGALQLNKKYPIWKSYVEYFTDNNVSHAGKIFRCTESHISNENFDESKWEFVEKIFDALPDDTSNSFFKTDRGNNAIKYAIQKAIALINYSARYAEVSFEIDAALGYEITLDDQVTIHDACFPNGFIVGKVIKTEFFADSEKRRMNISVACCPCGYFEDYFRILDGYCKEISVKEEICDPNPDEIVTNIEIQNSPEEQEKILSETVAKKTEDLISELRKHATKIKIHLHPINVVREIVTKINLKDFYL